MKLSILAGSTSQTVNVFVRDSSSTTGGGLTGLAYNTASLTAYYALPRAAAAAITLATQTVTGAYSSGGFVEISSANMPGWYRLDLPDAALASGRFVSVHLKGATNMAPLPIEIELTAWNNQDGVRGGMTALPNAAAEASGGLVTRGTGTGQVSVSSGQVIVQSGTGAGQLDFTSGVVKANATQWLGGTIPAVNVTGVPKVDVIDWLGTAPLSLSSQQVQAVVPVTQKVDVETIKTNPVVNAGTVTFPAGATLASTTNITAGTLTTVTTATNVTTVNGLAAGVITASSIASDAITAAKIADNAIDTATFASGCTIPRVTLADTLTTYTGDTPQSGDSYAVVNSGTHGNAAIKGYVDDIGTAGAGLSAIPWNAAWDAEVQSEVQDALEANNLDHLVKLAVDTDFATTVHLSSVIGHLADNGTSATFDRSTDSLEALRDRGDAAWVTATGFSTLDAAGVRSAVGLAAANLDTQLVAIAGYIDTEVGAVKTKTDLIPAGGFPANFAALGINASGHVSRVTLTDTATSLTNAATITGDANTLGTRLLTAIELDGSVYRFTEDALALAPSSSGTGLTAQQTRDAMKLAPTAGTPAAGSIDGELDTIAGLLTAAGLTVTVSSPVPAGGGTVRLVRGDDYLAADGRALTWTVTTGLNLATASTVFTLYEGTQESSGTALSLAVTASAVSGGYTLTRGLTAAQTAALTAGKRRYELKTTLSGGSVVTLAVGLVEMTQ